MAPKGPVARGLDQLEKALGKSAHVIGHNILRPDIEHLLAARPRLDRATAFAAIETLLAGQVCGARVGPVLDTLSDPKAGWSMAYALAWIAVAGGESVMPPWVRASFPQAGLILCDISCGDDACAWYATKNDPVAALRSWFGFDGFRPQPVDCDGTPLQQPIVAEVMRHANVLGILPTGTGKSVCYQVSALSLYEKTGALTVVISPLVVLMADQYQVPDLTSVNLSCDGRLRDGNATLGAIAAAKVGDPVTLHLQGGKWRILDGQGRVLGCMARTWAPPEGTGTVSGRGGAVIRWRKTDNDEAFQTCIRRDEWETILPELVFRRQDLLASGNPARPGPP
ncbi:hypothetical protein BYZ73_06280 [Rhodovulum viride]|uniref:DNA 3'-5' helicase n=1 Tax=Rhodovulum viride TaxID=1231134 RepID=A0ABX9DIK8_9RHOB|nr:hypothetical protein BYZ73_06280 [Rhodovulum viride]